MQNTSKEYWENRVRSSRNDKDLLFLDDRRETYWQRVKEQLKTWKDFSVLDVACGFGQFSESFKMQNYHGVDFSEEMIKKAQEYYGEEGFELMDAYDEFTGTYDVVFEVNSLHSMGMTPQEFYEKFKKNATYAVACLEADVFTIFPIYDR